MILLITDCKIRLKWACEIQRKTILIYYVLNRFEKKIRYASRKARADVRKRVKGRFVKAGEAYDYDPLCETRSYWDICLLLSARLRLTSMKLLCLGDLNSYIISYFISPELQLRCILEVEKKKEKKKKFTRSHQLFRMLFVFFLLYSRRNRHLLFWGKKNMHITLRGSCITSCTTLPTLPPFLFLLFAS